MKTLLTTVFIFFTLVCLAQNSEDKYSIYGEIIRISSPFTPFPDSLRANGKVYQEKTYPAENHYQDSTVLIFVPKKFKATGKTDLVFYFHGWFNNVDTVLQQFKLIEQFVASGKNAILVIPETAKNAPDSYGGKIEKIGIFRKLAYSVMQALDQRKILKNDRIGSIVLAGHSGGYRAISYILLQGGLSVNEVYLFDGLYDQLEKFAVWILREKGRFVNIYAADGGTKDLSLRFSEDLAAWKIPFLKIDEKDCTLGDLESYSVCQIFTTLAHNDVVHLNNSFYKLLLTSPNLKNH